MQPFKIISTAACLFAVANAFESALHACPAPCHGSPEHWTVYTSVDRLAACNQPMLLDFALHNPLDASDTTAKLFACTPKAGFANATHTGSATGGSTSCFSGAANVMKLAMNTDPSSGTASSNDLHSILDHAQNYFASSAQCDQTTVFGYFDGAVIGVYSGAAIDNTATTSSLIQRLHDEIPLGQSPKSISVQRCHGAHNADYIFGLAVDTSGDLAAVQKSLSSWALAKCVETPGTTKNLKVSVVEKPLRIFPGEHTSSTLSKRGNCTTINVVSGDSCSSLATKCGITGTQFTKYNPEPNLCSTLMVGERVCCTSGGLPGAPQQNSDGSCYSYVVQPGDLCSTIAAANGLTALDLSNFNDGTTWGWFGCGDLQLGQKMCLSTGTPPLPAPVSNAQCGPTVPGTEMPTNGTTLAALNPCPLNACCDIWGQCGITPTYCTNHTGPTGNPGTAPPHENGCISHCGTSIKNKVSPTSFSKIGYYESWNFDRSCLNLRAGDINVGDYTHVHWAFAEITDTFDVKINDTYSQWDSFMNLTYAKRIVSFGGWGYSTSPTTYDKLRNAMDPANVETFVQNIKTFVVNSGVDGVDFDWEYPGAPDIPGIPPGLASDGPNYLYFLKSLMNALPSGKTASIAAPASFWYLKAFPIAEMSGYVDYIVYMTYDLHGQWDYGNNWAQEGCPGGNCLRSQVNLTETGYALAMITKAGVPTNKINVGVTSYGRSFGMANESCTGPNCFFTGSKNDSTATEGRCTQTAGILANAEINEILGLGWQNASYYDQSSDSNIIVWNDTWAAYMDDVTKGSRTGYYKSLDFAGTVDWAIDLAEFTGDDGDPLGIYGDPIPPQLPQCTATFDSIEALGNASSSIPEHCSVQYTVQTLSKLLSVSMQNYTNMVNNDYDSKFQTYANAVAGNAGTAVHDFVYQNGSQYFSCIVTEMPTCCSYCEAGFNPDSTCLYCWNGTSSECYKNCPPLTCGGGQVPVLKTFNESEPCPPDYSLRGSKSYHEESVYWTLEADKASTFYSDIYANTGIDKAHLKFGNYDRGNDCPPSATIGDGDSCWNLNMDFNIPKPNGYSASDVANPKTTVQKALDKSGNLGPQMNNALLDLKTDSWIGDGTELVDSISMPILMIAQAVEEMSKVVSIANQITQAKQQEIMAAFLAAILFLVPVAGEVLGSVAELADVGAVLTMAGEAANIAEGVSSIVKDPGNAPLAIMNLIFAPAALGDLKTIAKAAKLRREMAPAKISKLGPKVSDRLDLISKVTGKCKP